MTTALPARLCDVCRRPGACCRELVLSTWFWADDGDEGVAATLAAHSGGSNGDLTVFVPGDVIAPTFKDAAGLQAAYEPRTIVQRRFSCRALGPSGRCTIYENRPGPCRRYEEGSDPLCVMYRGPGARE